MNFNVKNLALYKYVFSDIHNLELIKGTSTAFLFRIISLPLGYLFTFLVVKKYGADSFGIYSLSVSLITLLAVFSRSGLDASIIRFVASYKSQGKEYLIWDYYKKAFIITFLLSNIFTLIFFFGAPFAAEHIFNKINLTIYFRIASFAIFPTSITLLNASAFGGLKKIMAMTFYQYVAVYVFSLIFLAALSLFFNEDKIPLVTFVLGSVIAAIISQIFWFKKVKRIRLEKVGNGMAVKEIFKVSLPIVFTSSMQFFLVWSGTIMLGIFGAEEDVGIFSLVTQIATASNIFLLAANSIAAPKFAELYSEGKLGEMETVVHQTTKLVFWFSVPLLATFFIGSSFLLGIFGEEFKIGAFALIMLLVGRLVNALSGSVGGVLQMTGKQNVFHIIILGGTIINVLLNAVLIPLYGINGAAFAAMISMVFWNLASVVYIKIHFNFVTFYLPFILRNP